MRFGNAGTRPTVLEGFNTYLRDDPTYPNDPPKDFAGVPNADWNTLKLRRVGQQLTAWVNDRMIMDGSHFGFAGEVFHRPGE